MPPKPKYTREQVAAAAYEIIKTDGLAALTARELGKRLGTSASPIFTVFSSMDEVKMVARQLALAEFKQCISDYREYTPAFKRLGMMVVSYGVHAPEQFKLLFMQEHNGAEEIRDSIRDMGEVADVCAELLQGDYGLSPQEAELILEQMWTQAFGLGAMCAMRITTLTEEEIGRRLDVLFAGMMMLIKSGKLGQIYAIPEKNTSGLFQGVPISDAPDCPEENPENPEH